MSEINFFLSLGAGFLSFISPCCLPLYPAFLSYLTGMSIEELKNKTVFMHKSSLYHTICFLIGFSFIFIALGFSSSIFGLAFRENIDLIRRGGSIIIILFGLMVIGVIKVRFLMKERRFSFKHRPSGYFGSLLIGLAFAAGWTPCSGPILGSVLYLASVNPKSSIIYMVAYILGFAIPFLLLTLFISRVPKAIQHSRHLMKIGGGIMVLMGFLLFFDGIKWLTTIFSPLFGGFTGF